MGSNDKNSDPSEEQDDASSLLPLWAGEMLSRNALPAVAVLFAVGLGVMYAQLSNNHEQLLERTAVQHAEVYTHTLDRFRSLYASEVVDTAKEAGVKVSHYYQEEEQAIPLPITLSRELERDLAGPGNGANTKMYSPLPFPWRGDEGGLRDEFARDAWRALNENPEEPFYRIETYKGRPALRYAIAEQLKPECVECHNTYEGTPKTDWRAGDVRGILEIRYPIDETESMARSSVWETFGIMSPMLLIALVMLGLTGNQYRRWNRKLENRVEAQARTKAALRRSEARYRQMLDSIPLGVMVLTPDGHPEYANENALQVLGDCAHTDIWTSGSETCRLCVAGSSDDYPVEELPARRALSGESSTVMNIELRRGSRITPLLVSGAPIFDEDGEVALAIIAFQDVSDQKRLERQFRQAQRMQAVGRLAGGVAHDFNNLLTAIFSFATFAMHEVDRDNPAYGDLEQVLGAASRGEALTRQLLAFSRHRSVNPRVVEVNTRIHGIEKMLRRLLGEHIDFSSDLDDEVRNVSLESGALDQILVNLALNARDAMEDTGSLTITSSNVVIDAEQIREEGLDIEPGEYVCISVADDGKGMDEETRRHMFDPFYTTKSSGEGTGLGLSTCWGIVKQADGHIAVDSDPGEGTTIRVYLPGVDEEANDETPEYSELATGGDERVVVVEDDDPVRELVVRALSISGYRVLEASNAEDAIDICAVSPPGTLDLLLTDVVMPGLNGPELVDAVARMHPDMKVMYMSGYTDDVIFDHGVDEEDIVLLQKPFTPDVLAQRVRDVLDT